MSRAQVFITNFLSRPPDLEREVLGDIADVTALGACSETELLPILEVADALIVWHMIDLTPATLEHLRRCRVLVRAGVGFDNVDIAAAARIGLPVCNVPDYGTEEVADHAVALLLSLQRRIVEASVKVQAEGWRARTTGPVRRLRGQVAGIVGLGRIGTAAALRLKAFGYRVGFFDPYRSRGTEKALDLHRFESLDELLAASEVVSLHLPLSSETANLFDAERLRLMRDDAILINTARGGIIDSAALAAALAAGRLGGVGLDVLPEEPGDERDPVFAGWRGGAAWADRVVITPHRAWYSVEAHEEIRRKAAQNVRAALTGGQLLNIVNGVAGPRLIG